MLHWIPYWACLLADIPSYPPNYKNYHQFIALITLINHKRHHLCGLHPLPTASPVGSSHILQSSTEITAYKVHENQVCIEMLCLLKVHLKCLGSVFGCYLTNLWSWSQQCRPKQRNVHNLQSFTHRNAHMRIPPSPSYMELHPKTGHWQILQLSKWLPLKFWPTRPSFHGNSRASLQNVVSHIDTTRLWDITLPRCWRLQSFEAKCSREKHDQEKVLCS